MSPRGKGLAGDLIGIRHSDAVEDLDLEALHLVGARLGLVVKSKQMQKPVHDQVLQVVVQRQSQLRGFACHCLSSQGKIAKIAHLARRERCIGIWRKRQHVCWDRLATVGGIQLLDLGIGRKRNTCGSGLKPTIRCKCASRSLNGRTGRSNVAPVTGNVHNIHSEA